MTGYGTDRALRVDRDTRLGILAAAKYRCELNYKDCAVTATELADTGDTQLKAACKPCRQQREGARAQANRLQGEVLRRTRT